MAGRRPADRRRDDRAGDRAAVPGGHHPVGCDQRPGAAAGAGDRDVRDIAQLAVRDRCPADDRTCRGRRAQHDSRDESSHCPSHRPSRVTAKAVSQPRFVRVCPRLGDLGAWRSLVARTVRVGEVPGSNPGAPTVSSFKPSPRPDDGIPMTPHAEVHRVEVEDDGIRVRGELVGGDGARELTARRRADGREVTVPATLDGAAFDVRVPYRGARSSPATSRSSGTSTSASSGVGRHGDGVADKRHAYVFDLREVGRPPLPALLHEAQQPLHPHGPRRRAARPSRHRRPRRPAAAWRRRTSWRSTGWPTRSPGSCCGCVPPARAAERHDPDRATRTRWAARSAPTSTSRATSRAPATRSRSSASSATRDRPFFPFPPGVKVRVADDQRDRPLGGLGGPAAQAPAPAPQPAAVPRRPALRATAARCGPT